MKKIISTTILICSLSLAMAQDNMNELSLSVGAGMPLGDFASDDISSPTSGYAKIGANASLNYQLNLSTNFAVIGMLNWGSNGLDATKIAASKGPNMTVEDRSWTVLGFRVGGAARLPVSDRMNLEGRVTIGYNNTTFGGYKFTSPRNNTNEVVEATTMAFVYSIGAGAKLYLSDEMFIPLHVDFVGSKASFSNVDAKTNGTVVGSGNINQEMKMLVITVGFGLAF